MVVVDGRSRDDDDAIGVVLAEAEGYAEDIKFDQRDLRVRRAACSVSSSDC